jgi:hypothetical protein
MQKLASRGRPLGVFVAAAGITGDPENLTAAHSVLAQALQQGREIIVMTRREIEDLTETAELVNLLKRKRAQLAVRRPRLPRMRTLTVDGAICRHELRAPGSPPSRLTPAPVASP